MFHLSCKIIRSWVGMFRLWRIIIRSQGVDEVFRLSHMIIGSKGEGDDVFCICLFFKYFFIRSCKTHQLFCFSLILTVSRTKVHVRRVVSHVYITRRHEMGHDVFCLLCRVIRSHLAN